MKNKLMILSAVVLAVVLSSGAAWAFHDAGVAYCAGCHTMHNSQNGALVDTAHPAGNEYLLNNGNASDTCLRCHADYGQFAGGFGYGAGGDFYWLTKTYSWTAHSNDYFSYGESHGHNAYAPAYGIAKEVTLTSAPGGASAPDGAFLSDNLTCTSCHDPHGNTNFRLLYGATGPQPMYAGLRFDFVNDAPEAVGNSRVTNINESRAAPETDLSHTVYKDGMSDWCSNCHGDFHSGNTTNSVHPTGQGLGTIVANIYGGYVSSVAPTGGDPLVSYNALVPFEDVDADLATVDTDNYTAGPGSSDQVMCLTCHRAHASPFQDAGRWDFHETLLSEAHPAAGDVGLGTDDLANMWYGRTIDAHQRSLCNKCHVKDLGDDIGL